MLIMIVTRLLSDVNSKYGLVPKLTVHIRTSDLLLNSYHHHPQLRIMSTSTSLLQDVLRPHAFGVDKVNSKLAATSLGEDESQGSHDALDDSDDELVGESTE